MAKRGNGEGNIRKRANGTWEARISYVDPATGKRKTSSFYGKKQSEVRTKLQRAKERLEAGAPAKDTDLTVGEWLPRWCRSTLEASDRKPSTKALYRTLSNKHLVSEPFGSIPLSKLSESDVEELILDLRDKDLSQSTIRSVYAVLRQAMDTAVRDDLLADNPVAGVKRPKVDRTDAKFLPIEDVAKLLSETKDMRYHEALRLIASTGVRRGEALALRWSDVRFDRREIRVQYTVAKVDRELVLTKAKTDGSVRWVPLSTAMVDMLRARKTVLKRERLIAGDQYVDNEYVFPTAFGTLVDPRNVLREVQVAAKRLGLDGVGVHTLRHSAAVAWLEAGTHIRAVADLLGHSSVAITGDVYGHTANPVTRSAVDGLSEALDSGLGKSTQTRA